jgi:hypothetical protein
MKSIKDFVVESLTFPKAIRWIVDKNPGKAFLLTVWEKPYQLGDALREYKKYPEYNSLMDACKKFKFQPNNLRSAEELLLILDKWISFAWEFQYTSGKGGVNFIAATILNTLHKEYEGVFDENTKVLSKVENIRLDNGQALKKAPLRVVVAAIESHFSSRNAEFNRYSEYIDTAYDIVYDYFDR